MINIKPKKKSQAATEFLLITGFFLLLVVPTIFYFYTYAQEATEDVETSKAESIGNAIIDTAESVFYYGRYSRLTLNIELPDRITDIAINCTDEDNRDKCSLYMTILKQELFFPSKIPIVGEFDKLDIVQGKHSVVLETKHDSIGDYVEIDFKK